MLKFRNIAILILGCCLCAAILPAAASAEALIRIGGSGASSGAIRNIATTFEKKNPGIKIKVMSSLGSSGGIKALLGGALDITISARPLKDDEKIQGATVVFNARTPFVLMANKSVSQNNITNTELASILAGRQPNWADGKPIRLILRPEGDTDTKIIQGISTEINQAMKTALGRPDKHIALTDQAADKDIENIQGALGFSTISQHISDKLTARILKLNGVAPSLKTINNRSYPLVKEQMLVVKQATSTADIQRFISFLKSPEGTRLLENNGIFVANH